MSITGTGYKYPFQPDFQESILALLVRDTSFLVDYAEIINPNFFENLLHHTLAELALRYEEKHHSAPSMSGMLELVRVYSKEHSLSSKDELDLEALTRTLYHKDLFDAEYVKEKALRFAEHQSLKTAIMTSAQKVNDIEKHKLDMEKGLNQIREDLTGAIYVGDGAGPLQDIGYDMTEDYESLPKRLANSYAKVDTMSTGIQRLDTMMKGGIGRGEVGILYGPPKRGKSSVLVNFGAAAVKLGMTVVHYSFELKQADIEVKYASRITGMTDGEIQFMQDPLAITNYQKKMNAWFHSPHAKGKTPHLWLVYRSPGTKTAEWIRQHLIKLQKVKNVEPDLVIVDFMDRLKYTDDSLYVSGGNAMQKLVEIADQFECGVWTASQAGRQSEKKSKVTAGDIAESWRKIADCDIAISLNQTYEEKLAKKLRLFISEQRRGPSAQWIHCTMDFDRSLLLEDKSVVAHEGTPEETKEQLEAIDFVDSVIAD